jgi:hypothetical protein
MLTLFLDNRALVFDSQGLLRARKGICDELNTECPLG